MAIDGWTGDQNDIDMSMDDNFLVIGNTNGTISVYQNASVQTVQPSIDLNDNKLNTPDFFGGTNQFAANDSQPSVGLDLPLNYKHIQTIITPNTSVSSIKISPNSSKLYVGYYNKTLIIYNLKNYSYHFQFKEDLNDDIITCMELSELGKILVTGSRRGIIRIYIGNSLVSGLYLSQILF